MIAAAGLRSAHRVVLHSVVALFIILLTAWVVVSTIPENIASSQGHTPRPAVQDARITFDQPDDARGQNIEAALQALDDVIITPRQPLHLVADVIVPMRPEWGYRFAPARPPLLACLGSGAEAILPVVESVCVEAGLKVRWTELPVHSRHVLPFTQDLVIRTPPGVLAVFDTTINGKVRIGVRCRVMSEVALSAGPVVVEAPRRSSRVMVACVGDIMAAGLENRIPQWNREALLPQILRSSDVTLANLEAPVTTSHTPTPFKSRSGIAAGREFVFRSDPSRTCRLLKTLGVDAVSLANNHTLDYRSEGLADTQKYLAEAEIGYAGAGDRQQVHQPAAFGPFDSVVLLSYCARNTLPNADNFSTGPDRPGIALVNIQSGSPTDPTWKTAARDIVRAKQAARFVVVGVHWGEEGSKNPTKKQRAFARFCIEAGADMIWGHHPHVLQPVETYRNRIIAYSLGNFVFPAPRIETLLSSAVLCACYDENGVIAASLVAVSLNGQEAPYGLPYITAHHAHSPGYCEGL